MRLEGCVAARLSRERKPRRRSVREQLPRRRAERSAREAAVEFRRRVGPKQGGHRVAAEMLAVSERTLAQWRRLQGAGDLKARPRGRPLRRSDPATRNTLIAHIRDLGPQTGVEVLRSHSPPMPRSEITDVVRRFRQLWRQRRRRSFLRLKWTTPGTVWAMDHALPPQPIDGQHAAILAVRDLASGEPLLWRPTADMTAEATIEALEPLLAERGRPLVIKSDNGSAFKSEDMKGFLKSRGIHQLFSPPKTPRYNGSCEAGIRRLKEQTEYEAARHGRPGEWTGRDLDRARRVRTLLHAPDGASPVDECVRAAFAFTVAVKEVQAADELLYGRDGGRRRTNDHIMRVALSRALLEHGLLHIKRRRIPLRDCRLFPAKIT